MKKVYVVTGTPGTGKTVLAKKLAHQMHATYVDGNALIAQHHLSRGYDLRLKSRIVDTKKFVRFLQRYLRSLKGTSVVDSHLSHYLPRKQVYRCIVTTCSLPVLKRRLQLRDYPPAKIRENLDAEIFQVCLMEALEAGHHVLQVDTTKGLKARIS